MGRICFKFVWNTKSSWKFIGKFADVILPSHFFVHSEAKKNKLYFSLSMIVLLIVSCRVFTCLRALWKVHGLSLSVIVIYYTNSIYHWYSFVAYHVLILIHHVWKHEYWGTALTSAVVLHVIISIICQVAQVSTFPLSVNKINFDHFIY